MPNPSRAVPVSPPRPRPRPRRQWLALRVLAAAAFGVVGVAAIWQGFGLAGFGTDDHPWANATAFLILFVAGVVVFKPGTRWAVRALAVPLAFGAACGAWWLVPCDADGVSLRDAVARRDELKARLAATPPDDIESGVSIKFAARSLHSKYRQLGDSLESDLGRWGQASAQAVATRFQQIPLDDTAAARVLEERVRMLVTHFGTHGLAAWTAVDGWIERAVAHRSDELNDLLPGDWAGFDRTAPARHALADVGQFRGSEGTGEMLARAEEEWVNESVEALVKRDGRAGARAGLWRDIEKEILALQALDESEMRFQVARGRLFDLAHSAAESAAERLIRAERYHAALGVARRHAVEWNATATALGVRDVKRLDDLREKCAALAKPGVADPDLADETEVAPPPRAKP